MGKHELERNRLSLLAEMCRDWSFAAVERNRRLLLAEICSDHFVGVERNHC